MPEETSKAVLAALSLGYQVDPRAFDMLSGLSPRFDVESLIQKAVEKKRITTPGDKIITSTDVKELLPAETFSQDSPSSPLATDIKTEVDVLMDPTNQIAPLEAEVGFKKLFLDRFSRLLSIVKKRPDTKQIMAIESMNGLGPGKGGTIAGLLSSKTSKRNNVQMVLDDPTGSVRVVCGEGEVSRSALNVPLDSLVVVEVSRGKSGQLFVNRLIVPDIPDHKPVTASHKVYAVLLSDLHVGSRMFLQDDFNRFVIWLNGKLEDLDLVSRIKYLIIAGDLVDGVGVYPGQETQLGEKDLRKQYTFATQLVEQIPKHIQILISPGNHDPVRQALPQPAVPTTFAESLYKMDNVKLVGNPAYVKLHGVGFLVYHGKSLDDVIASTPNLSYKKPADAMGILLRGRHLAPTYGGRTALSPEERDMLVIDPVPEVFHAGHVHTIDSTEYRGTVLINSGTWQAQTMFQANMGLEPTPAIVPIVDLSSLEVTRRGFAKQGLDLAS